jgi:hypothetical protein
MPFFSDSDPGFRQDVATLPPLPRPVPEAADVVGAAFRQDNIVGSTVNAIANSGTFAPDPDHNPLTVIRGTPYERQHLDRFVGSRSEPETRSIMRRIDGEDADRKTLEAAGAGGTLMSILAGTLDPTLLLPGSVAVKLGREGYEFARAAVGVGAAAAIQSTAQESVLQATQETRTLRESLLNVGSATILAGLIGGAATRLMAPAERAAMPKPRSTGCGPTSTRMWCRYAAPAAGGPPATTAAPPLVPEPISASSVAQPVGAAAARYPPACPGLDRHRQNPGARRGCGKARPGVAGDRLGKRVGPAHHRGPRRNAAAHAGEPCGRADHGGPGARPAGADGDQPDPRGRRATN